jgi:hypothetical protein
MSRAPRRRAIAVCAAALGLGGWQDGCSRRAPEPVAATAPCEPVVGDLPAEASTDGLIGAFRLTLVADRGAGAGGTASGTVVLHPYDRDPRPEGHAANDDARLPAFGAARIDLAAVGAEAPGAIEDAVAAAPGVLVIEWADASAPGGRRVALRFGAEANRWDRVRFDGAYLTLTPAAITGDGFAGSWDSGGETAAGGYFCAVAEG